ncbi:hypothetical protein Taro_036409 [Colocasia esculenta]|uniref:RING-type E3 ubiquitin transferase n=1 Tax=Colocasia esculenta TaxID=4460 RepID=A0A843W1H7_COLES|nr:hypothetical protein [Colocasia esculenta]
MAALAAAASQQRIPVLVALLPVSFNILLALFGPKTGAFVPLGMVSLVRTSSRMRWGMPQIDHGDGRILSHSHRQLVSSLPVAPYSSSSSPSFIDNLQKDSLPLQSSQVAPPPPPPPPSSGSSKISPAVLFIIVILAVIFFISGLLHLLVRFLIKQSPASPQSSGRHTREIPGSDALQRQLQQLFHLHDSGLDQAFIDALPVFLYKEIVGAKEPFDCAVCLCEFADEDKLRLLPVCSHAFHLNCIDTWLLSNSTCPLCRGTLFVPGLAIENPVFDLEDLRDEEGLPGDREDGFSAAGPKPVEVEEGTLTEKRVFPVRLGKFRSVNNEEDACGPVVDVDVPTNNVKREEGESSSSSLDARRCYSMGSFQYVVGNFNLQVSLSNDRRRDGADFKDSRRRELTVNCAAAAAAMDDRANGKRLWAGSRGESFSVSKIWQWSSKKGKFPVCSDTASLDGGLPWLRTSGGDS